MDSGYEIVLSPEAEEKLVNYARQIGRSEDDVFEFLITQYLQRQLSVLEKRSKDTGVPFNDLLNMQFVQLLDWLVSHGRGIDE